MSKHLLRKLLNLDTVDQETNNNNTSTSNDNDNKKYASYYSTDQGKNVLTKIPKHMKISKQSLPEQSNDTYTDDLSDVSSHLLKSIIREENINRFESKRLTKPLTYYSTDKNSYVTAFTPEKMHIIGSHIPSESVTSKYSKDFSNHSSFDSDQETSYDSFYDYYDNYQNKPISDISDASSFNIFKSSHRERKPISDASNKSDASDASSFNIFKSSHRERKPQDKVQDIDSILSHYSESD